MSKPLKILITSGGIFSKVDDIRFMGNFSKGTTGALIAEEFLKKGARVIFLHSKDSLRPFRHRMIFNPEKDACEELSRIMEENQRYLKHRNMLSEFQVCDFQEYYSATKRILTQNKDIDAVILAAAVADYGGDGKTGKISSELDFMELKLPRNPKVISEVKKWRPGVFQVGFKLLTDAPLEKLIDEAYQHGIRNHSNLTVANSIEAGNFAHRATVLITPEKGLTPLRLEEIAPKVAEAVIRRISKKHYQTDQHVIHKFETGLNDKIQCLKKWTRTFWNLNLFEPYYEGAGAHFGFVAMRTGQNTFLITARASDKSSLSEKDIVHVENADFHNHRLQISSFGKKASLNANVPAKIFAERPEVNIILHAHIFPGFQNKTELDFAPGTEEDLVEIMKHLRNNEASVELENHGVMILGKTFADILPQLNIQPAYTRFPEFYDLIYGRFQKSTDFVDLVRKNVNPQNHILDLAAGTGEVSAALVNAEYGNIEMADLNKPMLKVALSKIGKAIPTHVTATEKMDLGKTFDAIVMRQAINYFMTPVRLESGLRKIYEHLKPGGTFIFNAPNFSKASSYGNRNVNYETGDWKVTIEEMNAARQRIITHTQRCTLIRKGAPAIRKFYDLNRFRLFTKGEFEKVLLNAGFKSINFFSNGLLPLDEKSKSLYCVATK